MSVNKRTEPQWRLGAVAKMGAVADGFVPDYRAGYITIGENADGEPDCEINIEGLNAPEHARRIVAAMQAVAGIPTEALEEAARFADGWHRLGCLRDLCDIERAAQHREPRPR